MSGSRRALALCVAMACAAMGCVVPGEVLEGKACPCGTGYRCVDGVRCVEGAAPDLDASPTDASLTDGGARDAMAPDAMAPDAMPPDAMPPDDGPVASYLCEALDDGFLRDATGNARDARCDAAGCPAIVPGRVGNACDFTAESRRLRVSYDPVFVPESDGAFSVSLWVWFHDTPLAPTARSSAIGLPAGSGLANVWQVFFNTGPETVFVTEGVEEGLSLRTGRTLPLAEWVHLAVVYDRGTKVVYIDGEEVVRSTGEAIVGSNQDVLIGADENEGSVLVLPLDGMLDEILFYDRALPAAEVVGLATVP